MSGALSVTLQQVTLDERRTALRHLLRHPLTTPSSHPEAYTLLVRHRAWLKEWFVDHTGWKLAVDPAAGFARLYKVPWRPDSSRPARPSKRAPFDVRRYVLLCFTLVSLEDEGTRSQTTLATLADSVRGHTGEEPWVERFDATRFGERRAFVDVLRLLIDLGVLSPRDGETEGYAQNEDANALYDVNERLLGQLVSAPLSPALAGDPDGMLRESYAETEEGRRLRARHTAMRALLEDPVVYYDDLPPAVYDWLDHSRGAVYRTLSDDLGFEVERRREGLAAVDTLGEVSDDHFPDGGSTVKHAALLLAERLTAFFRERDDPRFTSGELLRLVERLVATHGDSCGWSAAYAAETDGPRRLLDDAVALLEGFGLVCRTHEGIVARPALARFVPAAPGARKKA